MKICLGLAFAVFTAFIPMWANVLANAALKTDLEPKSKVTLLVRAYSNAPCDPDILQKLGDTAATNNFWDMAAWAYEKGTICAPQQAAFHFLLAEATFALRKNGFPELVKAMQLEPNNPVFRGEAIRITTLLSQSQSH